ncbi:MAG TPA: glycosyltransferase domain-containing protein [Hyphomicrobiaceae bacterium]|nr:glycosyltransferase domain-containing protein [Hyphomicrobiaceae bacterium]
MRIVVYTAVIGKIDRLWSILPGSSDVEHVAFVDEPKHEVGLWGGAMPSILDSTKNMTAVMPTWQQRVVKVPWGNRRTARHYKTLPHRYLPDADVWIWVDGNVRLRMHPLQFVKRYGGRGFATLAHPDRRCLYVEAQFCDRNHKDDHGRITRQINRYRSAGMPAGWGLAETRAVIRRKSPELHALSEDWWREIERGSLRDQISLPFVCWKRGIRWDLIPGVCGPHNDHPGLVYLDHTK